MTGRATRGLGGPLAAALLLLLGFIPWVILLPGGHGPKAGDFALDEWVNGTVLVLGVALVLAIASRRVPGLWRAGRLRPVLDAAGARPWTTGLLLAGLALAAYAVVARTVLSGRPLLIDEIIQLFQARMYARGRLWEPVFAHPEFFSSQHVIDLDGKYYGQFPVGGPAFLLLGVLAGAPWLVMPVAGACSVLLWWRLLPALDARPAVRLAAAVLFAFAPFTLFMSGSHMNHVTLLTCLLVAMLALARVTGREAPAPGWALLLGLGLGAAATVRPVDAVAFALPAGAWLLGRTLRRPARWPELLVSALGIALPVAALLYANMQTTGHPLRFGYTVLWGAEHDLGFHTAPYGPVHTPLRGLELASTYLLRLQTYLFDTPLPGLVPIVLALALGGPLRPFDRYLLASGALLLALYFAYWHDGLFLGPRFMYPLLPALALWTARCPAAVRERWGEGGLAHRVTVFAALAAVAIGVTQLWPLRARQYRNFMFSLRWDADAAARAAGVRDALVLVRESWGAQLMVRMWALGVSRGHAEKQIIRSDACQLEDAVRRLERAGVRGAAAEAELTRIQVDTLRLTDSPVSEDKTEKYLPGTPYGPACQARVREDQAGFTLFPPLLAAEGNGNVYARDLHARDSLLVAAFAARPVFLLKPPSAELGALPRFYPVDLDSARAAWRAEAP